MVQLFCAVLLAAGVAGRGIQHPMAVAEAAPGTDNVQGEQADANWPWKWKWKPLINSELLQHRIQPHNLLYRAKILYGIAQSSIGEFNHPTRVIGSLGHIKTVDYIYSTIKSLGDYYTITNQTFPAVMGRVTESRLVLADTVPASQDALSLTPPTKDKEPVFGNLTLVANTGCDASDFPAAVSGNIAFISRGSCTFSLKSENAGRAGAIAAVIYNNGPDGFSGTLGQPTPDQVATMGISGTDAAPFVERLQNGEVIDASVYIDAYVMAFNTTNIIAQTTGGDQDNCVMVGGHSDSVEEGPGINDDGSGTISLLELATQLTHFRVRNCVRIGWWAAEEEGLLGSDYYVSQLTPEENLKIRMFQDYDMMASPNFAYQIYNATNAANPVGSEQLRDLYVAWYESKGLNYTFIPFDGRSDYDAFIENGIPGGGIATGAEGVKTAEEVELFGGVAGAWYDPCYHQLCDDVGNLNMTAFETNTKLIAHAVATYARSLDGFPKREPGKVQATKSKSPKTYHGPKAIM